MAAALAKPSLKPGEMVPIPKTVRRILIVWNPQHIQGRSLQRVMESLGEMGFEGPAIATADFESEDIRIFSLDGLPAPDTGLIQKLLAQAYDAPTPRT